MAFYWRGNTLLTKHASIVNNDKVWTTFLMDIRETEEVCILFIQDYTIIIHYISGI